MVTNFFWKGVHFLGQRNCNFYETEKKMQHNFFIYYMKKDWDEPISIRGFKKVVKEFKEYVLSTFYNHHKTVEQVLNYWMIQFAEDLSKKFEGTIILRNPQLSEKERLRRVVEKLLETLFNNISEYAELMFVLEKQDSMSFYTIITEDIFDYAKDHIDYKAGQMLRIRFQHRLGEAMQLWIYRGYCDQNSTDIIIAQIMSSVFGKPSDRSLKYNKPYENTKRNFSQVSFIMFARVAPRMRLPKRNLVLEDNPTT